MNRRCSTLKKRKNDTFKYGKNWLLVVVLLLAFLLINLEVTAGFKSQSSTNNSTLEEQIDKLLEMYKIPQYNGKVSQEVTINSEDGNAELKIPKETIASDLIGNPLYSVEVYPVEIGAVASYDFQPDGATFSPAAYLSIKYDTSNIPSGSKEADLVIKTHKNGRWIPLETEINPSTHTATAEIYHFSVVAVFAGKTSVFGSSVVEEEIQIEEPKPVEESKPQEPPKEEKPPEEPAFEAAVWGDEVPAGDEEEVEEEPGFGVVLAFFAITVCVLISKKGKN